MAKKSQAPAIVVAINAETQTALRSDGSCAYFAEGTLGSFARAFAPVMAIAAGADGKGGQVGNFTAYIAFSRQWRIGYDLARMGDRAKDADPDSISLSDASQDAFERRVGAAKREGLLKGDRPKSQGADATKKAAQRAKAADVKGTPAQWRSKAAELLAASEKAPEADRAKVMQSAEEALRNARTLERAADIAAKKKAAEAVSKPLEAIREALAVLRTAGDVKGLHAVLTIAKKFAEPHVARAAKEAAKA